MYTIDVNVIIRFLVRDNEYIYKKSFEIFQKIEILEIEVFLEYAISRVLLCSK